MCGGYVLAVPPIIVEEEKASIAVEASYPAQEVSDEFVRPMIMMMMIRACNMMCVLHHTSMMMCLVLQWVIRKFGHLKDVSKDSDNYFLPKFGGRWSHLVISSLLSI